ncbi:MAG: hypothetical protein R2834_04630 [Rhodothermales bacterium]
MTRSRRLVPFLLAIGPLWIALFAGSDLFVLRIAAGLGALALSLGLILMLARLTALEEKGTVSDLPQPSPPEPSRQEHTD